MAIKEFYLGANTPDGFFSYYDYIMPQAKANRIICIKGGPGTGKSSLMKKIGMEMSKHGFDVEMIHCSSDNNSLDGIAIPTLGIALLDGTSPHVVDPKNPAAVDEILNMGDCWDRDGIAKNKEQIIRLNQKKKETFQRAYRYLRSAKEMYDDILHIHKLARNDINIEIEFESLLNEFAEIPYAKAPGFCRKLFASAITPNGIIDYLDTILTQKNIYNVCGSWGSGSEEMLKKIADYALTRGFYIEAYYCPLSPKNRMEHLVIPAMNLAFTTKNKYHNNSYSDKIINLDGMLNEKVINEYKDILDYDYYVFDTLLQKAISTIAEAKSLHDRLETYYIPYMDFEKINRLNERLTDEILG